MNGQSPAGAGVAAQTTPTNAGASNGAGENGNNQAAPPAASTDHIGTTRLSDVLSRLELNPEVLRDLGRDPGNAETRTPEAEAGKTPAAAPGAATPAAAAQGAPAPNEGQQQQQAAGGGEQERAIPDEWPESARAQVMEERRKRQTRTQERDTALQARQQAEARAQQLEQMLQQTQQQMQARPVTVAPSQRDPLADVQTEAQLAQAIREYEELQDFAVQNPDGAEGVLLGRDANGQEVRRDYTAAEIARMKLDADRILNKAVPAKAAYLQQAREAEAEARTAHPNLFNPQTAEANEARQILQLLPELTRFPDFALWLGDAIAGRALRLAKAPAAGTQQQPAAAAAAAVSPAAKAILRGQQQPPIAPSVPVARQPGSGAGAAAGSGPGEDVDKARETLADSGGSEDALNDYIATLRNKSAGQRGGRQAALV